MLLSCKLQEDVSTFDDNLQFIFSIFNTENKLPCDTSQHMIKQECTLSEEEISEGVIQKYD